MDSLKHHQHKETGKVELPRPGTPCFLAAAPFFLLSTVLFYYVFAEDYSFKWTLILIGSGCVVLAPGAVLVMLGMRCFSPGWDAELDNNADSSSRQTSIMSVLPKFSPDLQWKAMPVQSDEPILTKMKNYGFDNEEDEESTKLMSTKFKSIEE